MPFSREIQVTVELPASLDAVRHFEVHATPRGKEPIEIDDCTVVGAGGGIPDPSTEIRAIEAALPKLEQAWEVVFHNTIVDVADATGYKRDFNNDTAEIAVDKAAKALRISHDEVIEYVRDQWLVEDQREW